ncbi:PKD domain-containing protein [bacterium]|nr:PKD domain-containing protein [bacterium]
MKKLLISIFLILTALTLKAQWSEPITISDGYVPDFDIDPANGHLHIVSIWGKDLKGVIYTETDEWGNIVSPQAVIPGTAADADYFNFGATVAVDHNGFPHVCFRVPKGDNVYDVYYTRKNYSGWLKNPLLITANKKRGYVVRMAIDSQNKVHIAVGYLKPGGTNIDGPIAYFRVNNTYVEHSIMDLNTYITYFRLDNRCELTVGDDDAIHIIAGCPGVPSVSYEGPITYFRSTDGGDTFETVADVHNSKCTHRNGAPDIAVDDFGYVHILYGAKIDGDCNEQPSLRYVRMNDDKKLIDKPITYAGQILPWGYGEGVDPKHGKNYGLGSIAVSDDGTIVMAAYTTRPTFHQDGSLQEGDLYVTLSSDNGVTWSSRQLLAEIVDNNEDSEGRNLHLIRSYKNHFYVIYPDFNPSNRLKKIRLQYLRNYGDNPPVAHAGGPYNNMEGSPLVLNASGTTDSGQNPGIVKYEWDLDNDGEYELSNSQPVLETTVDDDYYATIRLRVTDHAGYTDEAATTLLVENVPPGVNAGPDTTIDEAQTLDFHCTVNDPGTEDSHTFLWDFGDGSTDHNQSVSHTYINDGEFQVTVVVTDNNGGSGTDTLTVTVNNIPPVADAGGPYHGPLFTSIQFSGSATDASVDDMQSLTFQWDLDNDSYFETQGQTCLHSFNTEGEFIVWLKVLDNKDTDVDSAVVTISNDPPVISSIENQTITEGNLFNPVELDHFVDDPDQEDTELVWGVSGQDQLQASILNRILNLSAPDEDWFGSEKLLLTVTDTGGLTDTTHVRFTITPVNDPPVWTTHIPDFVTDEDDPFYVSLDSLWKWATDVDDPDTQLSFSISTQDPVDIMMEPENHRMKLQGKQDWNGEAMLVSSVFDTSGLSDNDTSRITIRSVPDKPAEFRLIEPMLLDSTDKSWPDSIAFRWHATYDPDNPQGIIYYTWSMNHLDGFNLRTLTVFDTTAVYYPEPSLLDGRYLWYITAYTSGGLSIRSQNSGFIIVGKIDTGTVSVMNQAEIPETFDLKQNYPNPFNPVTRIVYQIPKTCDVKISIYNSLGQKIRELVQDSNTPGVYTIFWNGHNDLGQKVPTGIYICRMSASGHIIYRKMMLIQ